jgi:hypothetical protein
MSEIDSRFQVARGWGQGLADRYGISFGGDENILDLDNGNGCITL